MKVPPKPPTYSKDRTLTRRTVKGAAGGMLGVHYEDPRRNDVNTIRARTERASAGAGENRDGSAAAASLEAHAATARAAGDGGEPAKVGGPKEEQEMVLDDEDANTRDAKKRQRDQIVSRDRLTVDKDAPELRRTRDLWAKIMGEDDDDDGGDAQGGGHAPDPEELDVEAIGEAIARAGDDAPLDREALFARPGRSRIGDPRLVDPEAIQRALRTPIAYAKQVMVLGQAFERATGARRDEVVAYMAAMYAALPDRRFARQALKEFGPATGILDVYPLEIVEELVLRYPGSLPKVGFGQLFARPTKAPDTPIEIVEGRSAPITYPKNLKVRGFALAGGGHPGYLFEPDLQPGQYRLRIDAPGRYRLLISAITRSGHAIIDRLRVNVRPAGRRPRAAPAASAPAVPRDEAKVAAWPHPTVPAPDLTELLARAAEKVQDTLLSMGELVSRREQDSARGPKGEAHEDFGYWPDDEATELPSMEQDEAETTRSSPALDEDTRPDLDECVDSLEETLSNAEQAMLRIALATQVTAADLVPHPEPTTTRGSPPLEEEATAHAAPAFASSDAQVDLQTEAGRPNEEVIDGSEGASGTSASGAASRGPLVAGQRRPRSAAGPSPSGPGPEPRADSSHSPEEAGSLAESASRPAAAPPPAEHAVRGDPAIESRSDEASAEAARTRPAHPFAPPLDEASPETGAAGAPRSASRPGPHGEGRARSAAGAPPLGRGPTGARQAPRPPSRRAAEPPPGRSPAREPSTPAPPNATAPEKPPETMVVRVRSKNPKVGRGEAAPDPLVAPPRARTPAPPGRASSELPAVRLSSPMDEPETAPPAASGEFAAASARPAEDAGFVAARAPLPDEAHGETDAEVPSYPPGPVAPPSGSSEPLVRPPRRQAPPEGPAPARVSERPEPPAIPVDDLVLDDEPE